jgi:hypothetical protein
MPSGVNPGDVGSATSTAAAASVNHTSGTVTTEALTTAAGADYSFTLTDANISTDSVVMVHVGGDGTNTTVPCLVHSIIPGAGSATFKVRNNHASAALNGTLKLRFVSL